MIIMKIIYCFVVIVFIISGCGMKSNNPKNKEAVTDNALMTPSVLPYGAPDFTKIKDSDFKPAILAGILIISFIPAALYALHYYKSLSNKQLRRESD